MKAPQVFTAPVDTSKALLVAGGGAAVFAAADALLEAIYYTDPEGWRQKFPYLLFNERIPPLDDWLGFLVPAGLLVAGAYTMNPLLAYFGFGGTLYGGGALLKDFIQRNKFLIGLQAASVQYAKGGARVAKQLSTYA